MIFLKKHLLTFFATSLNFFSVMKIISFVVRADDNDEKERVRQIIATADPFTEHNEQLPASENTFSPRD